MFKVVSTVQKQRRKKTREGRQRSRFGSSLECRRSKRERGRERENTTGTMDHDKTRTR